MFSFTHELTVLQRACNFPPATDRRALRPFGFYREFKTEVHYMAASAGDIAQLQTIVRWGKALRPSQSSVQTQSLIEALEKAIRLLEEPNRFHERIKWILSAFKQSIKKVDSELYIISNKDVLDWAMSEIDKIIEALEISND